MKNSVIAILGPTASGKTEVSIKIAEKINGAIINLDSVQIYKYLDIGSAKPSLEERNKVPHYLIDIFEPDKKVDMKRVIDLAIESGKEAISKGYIPIYVGGTGLYFKGLFNGVFEGPSRDENIRLNLKKIKDEKGIQYLYEELKKNDPETASRISKNDYIRIERALEVFYATGKPISYFHKNQKWESPFEFIKIGLLFERKELYQRIEKRVETMIENGLIEETKKILEKYPRSEVIETAIGYKEVKDYLDGKIDYTKMVYLIKRNTRRFAKRQITLFKPFKDVHWFKPSNISSILDLISKNIEKN